jgi:hypothetical protein
MPVSKKSAGCGLSDVLYCETPKKPHRSIQKRKRGMLTYCVVLLHDNARPHTTARTRALPEHFNLELFDHPLTALISLRATTTCLPIWRTCQDHRASKVMRSYWKVSKRGWAHRRQTSLTQAYKNLFPDMSASIPAVTTLRSSVSMSVFLYIFFISLLVLLTVHRVYFPNSSHINILIILENGNLSYN